MWTEAIKFAPYFNIIWTLLNFLGLLFYMKKNSDYGNARDMRDDAVFHYLS